MSIDTAHLAKFIEINPEGITQSYPHDRIEYIDISSVSSGHMVESSKSLKLEEAPSRAKRIVRPRDTILAMVRPNLRSFLFIKNPKDNTVVSTGFAVLRAKSNVDSRFIYYAVTDPSFTDYLANNAKGTSYPAVDSDTILRGKIPDFGLEQQQLIASILSAYDDLIENNRRRIQLLEQSAQLLYKEWFVQLRFPGHEHVTITDGVPEGWERKTIAGVCETVGGGTPSTKVSEYWGGDVTWVVPTDVTKNDCLILLDSERKITEKGLRESSAKLVPANTILMTSRASVGFFALMDIEVCTNQGFINIISHDEEMRMYLLFDLMSRVAEIRSNAKGTTYPEISKGRFRQMDIIIPTKNLVVEFAKIVCDIMQQVRYLKHSTLKLTQARDLLLPRLMNGEIAIEIPNSHSPHEDH